MKIKIIFIIGLKLITLDIGMTYASPTTRCIADGVPVGHVIKQLTRSSMCPLGADSPLPNALVVDSPSQGAVICGGYITKYKEDNYGNIIKTSIESRSIPIPDGYVVTKVFSSLSQTEDCDPGLYPISRNALMIDLPSPGMEVCGTFEAVEVRREVPIPDGYVVTSVRKDSWNCEKDSINSLGFFSLRLELPTPGMEICSSYPIAQSWMQGSNIPGGYVIDRLWELRGAVAKCGKDFDGFDWNGSVDGYALQIVKPYDGIEVCDRYPIKIDEFKQAPQPDGYEVIDQYEGDGSCSGLAGLDNNTLLLASTVQPVEPGFDVAWLVPIINLVLF